jgi:MtN3 and saliva related transmembrane protein
MITGITAAICTTISIIPQVLKIIKLKETKDISLIMYIILTTGVFLWIMYGISIKDPIIITANTITFILSSTILVYKIKYG